jgi:crossover junction endodeoxyribonuclease RuvC
MRVLGIDPGTVNMGYGVIEDENDELIMLHCGVLTASSRLPLVKRLPVLYGQLLKVIADFHPDVVAIEEPFVARNVRSALSIGQAEAIAILAAANNGIPVHTYAPAKVKQVVTDYGGAGKEQVQQMVQIQLGLSQVPQPSDAADALAVAICHFQERRLAKLIAQSV